MGLATPPDEPPESSLGPRSRIRIITPQRQHATRSRESLLHSQIKRLRDKLRLEKNRPAGHELLRHEGGDSDHCQAAVLHFRVVKPLEVPAKPLSHFLESQRVEAEVAWHPAAPWLVRERVGPQPPH